VRTTSGGDAVQSQDVTLRNKSGLHARPATVFVQLAQTLSSVIKVENLDRPGAAADGKSIIELLSLGATTGSTIRISAAGANADEDLAAIAAAVDSGLGEDALQGG
jgi:phosphotransferase system HPr (HPr) family protein